MSLHNYIFYILIKSRMFTYSHKDFFTLKVNYTHQVKVKNKWPITFPDLFLLTYRMTNKIDTKQMMYNIGIFLRKCVFLIP